MTAIDDLVKELLSIEADMAIYRGSEGDMAYRLRKAAGAAARSLPAERRAREEAENRRDLIKEATVCLRDEIKALTAALTTAETEAASLRKRVKAAVAEERERILSAAEFASAMREDPCPGWDWFKLWADGDEGCVAVADGYRAAIRARATLEEKPHD